MTRILQVLLAACSLLTFVLWLRDQQAGDVGVALMLSFIAGETLRRSSHPVVQVVAGAALVTVAAILVGYAS